MCIYCSQYWYIDNCIFTLLSQVSIPGPPETPNLILLFNWDLSSIPTARETRWKHCRIVFARNQRHSHRSLWKLKFSHCSQSHVNFQTLSNTSALFTNLMKHGEEPYLRRACIRALGCMALKGLLLQSFSLWKSCLASCCNSRRCSDPDWVLSLSGQRCDAWKIPESLFRPWPLRKHHTQTPHQQKFGAGARSPWHPPQHSEETGETRNLNSIGWPVPSERPELLFSGMSSSQTRMFSPDKDNVIGPGRKSRPLDQSAWWVGIPNRRSSTCL